ncbi:hypothetical protein [Flectobacillus major]|uniref:hypothetical protein n=1 Tax=Flectobacillus major TaxID=103 RepID=UPI0004087812|nr:hypothetical protein [Flectobacillus major]
MDLNSYPFHHSFDKDYIAELYDNETQYFIEIVEHLLQNIEPELEQLNTCFLQDDYEGFAKKLHKLSSMVGCIGQLNASKKYKEIETYYIHHGNITQPLQNIYKEVLQTLGYIRSDYEGIKKLVYSQTP